MVADAECVARFFRRVGGFDAYSYAVNGPLLIVPRKYNDVRGFFMETYSRLAFTELGVTDEFVQDNHSLSTSVGTLRGLHYQRAPHAQGKLVRVLRGRILDVVADIRAGSPTYATHVAVNLSAENGCMLWVPVGFAHGFVTQEPDTEVVYKCTAYYSPANDGGIAFDDPSLNINWPVSRDTAILSEKDRKLPRLTEIERVGF